MSSPALAAVVGSVAIAIVLGAAAIVGPDVARRFPAAAAAPLVFAGVQVLFRGVRFDPRYPISPLAWASYAFALQLAVVPLLVAIYGPTQETLPWMPSDTAVNGALLLQSLAYVAFASGVALARSRASPGNVAAGNLSPIGIAVLVGGGLIGLAVRFESPAGLIAYATGRGPLPLFVTDPTGHASVSQAASDFLLPCLSFGLVAAICLYAERFQPRELLRLDRMLIIGILIALSAGASAVYNYNRASIFVPAVSLVAAWSLRRRRVPYSLLLLCGLIGFLAFLQLGSFRDHYLSTRGGTLNPSQVVLQQIDPVRTIQVYSNGPQFLGFAIENAPTGTPFLGGSLIASVLAPVPVVGRAFRDQSGEIIYNNLIYGVGIAYDQIIPLHAELWWNFGVIGVVLGFIALGLLVTYVDRRFRASPTLFWAYIWQFWGIWIGFLVVGAPAVLAQVVVYSVPPIVIGLAITHLLRGRLRLET